MASIKMTRGGAAVAVVCVLAFSAIATCSASAAEWFIKGTKLSGSQAGAATARVDATAALVSGVAGTSILCTGGTTVQVLEAGSTINMSSTWTGTMVFMGCSAMEPAECDVQEEIGTEPLEATLKTSTAPADTDVIKPKTGSLLTTLAFTGEKCSAIGEDPVRGQLTALMPSGQTELAMQPAEGLGTMENNSLFIGSSHAYIEAGRSLLLVSSAQPFSFH